MSKTPILIVDHEIEITESLGRSLRSQFNIFTANTCHEAIQILEKEEIAVILTDQRIPGMTGVELLAEAQRIRPAFWKNPGTLSESSRCCATMFIATNASPKIRKTNASQKS